MGLADEQPASPPCATRSFARSPPFPSSRATWSRCGSSRCRATRAAPITELHAADEGVVGRQFIQPRVDTRTAGGSSARRRHRPVVQRPLLEQRSGRSARRGGDRPLARARRPADRPAARVAVALDRCRSRRRRGGRRSTGALKRWFDGRRSSVLFLRPDRFVAAACIPQHAPEISRALLRGTRHSPTERDHVRPANASTSSQRQRGDEVNGRRPTRRRLRWRRDVRCDDAPRQRAWTRCWSRNPTASADPPRSLAAASGSPAPPRRRARATGPTPRSRQVPKKITGGVVPEERLRAYVDTGPQDARLRRTRTPRSIAGSRAIRTISLRCREPRRRAA